jgi:NAD(P)-dependent dehydrogenase (short-subunit alcohol dehydrogenase family)
MTTSEHAGTKTVLVIGASRGLGLAIAEQFLERGRQVIGTVRGSAPTPLHALGERWNGQLEIETVDITVPADVRALRGRQEGRMLDVLFVNAGVKNDDRETIADVSTEEFVRVMVTNALSPLRVVEAFGDLVDAEGTIAVMSSGQGSVSNNERGGYEVYRASKAALNTLMRSYAARHAAGKRTLLLLAPGWIRTDMGGAGAPLAIEDSIPHLVQTIESQRGKPGLQYLDYRGRTVPW